jgi:hypothetical protein
MSVLKEDSWVLLSASAFGLLQFVVSGEVLEENLASCIYIVGKEKCLNNLLREL